MAAVQEAYVLMVDDEHQQPASMATHTYHDPQPEKPSHSSLASSSKVAFLDGVRGLAAILVVTQHCGYLSGVEVGQCGVDLFFVLSAFLLTMLFYKKSEALAAQRASYTKWLFTLIDYISKRFFRVYPLFAIVTVVVWLLPDENKRQFFFVSDPQRFELLRVLTFEFPYRYHVFWTLPLEIAYYFLVPVAVLVAIGLKGLWWTPYLPLVVWIWTTGWTQLRVDHQGLKPHLPTFVSGSLAAVLYIKLDAIMTSSKDRSQPPVRKWLFVIRMAEILVFALLLSEFFRGLLYDWLPNLPRPSAPRPHFIGLHVAVLIVIEMLLPSWLAGIFEWNVLRFTGKISFSVYLLHSFVIYANPIRHQEKYYNKLFSQLVLIALLATASYQLIEVPCQMLSARISKVLTQCGDSGASPSGKIQSLLVDLGDSDTERKTQTLF